MSQKGFNQALSQLEFSALKKGKHLGFVAAYQLYADHVYSLAFHLVKNKQVALDLMQTAFETLLAKCASLRCVNTLGAWLKQCTINACMTYFRKYKNEILLSDASDEVEDIPIVHASHRVMLTNQTDVLSLLDKLPILQRSIVYFHSVCGLKHSEIAANLDIKEASSRKAYSRALKQLEFWVTKSGYNND